MKNKFKIAIVLESIDIDDSSGSKANVALIQNLHETGHHISVFHYTKKEIQLKNIDCQLIKERKRGLYFLSRFQRVFQRVFKINISKFLERIFGFSFTFFNDTNSIKAFVKNKAKQFDLIITLSKGASFRPHYALLKLPKSHQKWLAYVHDPYPFHYYPKPYDWVESGYKMKEKFFRRVSEKAKYSGFPSLLLKEWMGNYFPNFLKTGIVIPHQTFKENFKKIDFPVYFDKNKFTILHAGNLMKQRSPKGLIEGFLLFLSNNSKAKENSLLLLLGSADYHKEMLSKYKNEIPELYVSNGSVPFKEVYCLQKNVSVNVILESKSEISPFLPGKFPHCVTANKPILLLAPTKSETKRLLGEEYPFYAEVDNINEIANIFQKLYEQWSKNPDDLKLNRKDLEHYISADYLSGVINSIIK